MTPPRAVCAPDKLRGALDAPGAAAALAAGARAAGWDAVEHPLADGGEGTLDVLLAARGGERIAVQAVDALGRPCAAEIGLLADGTAVVETASAIGLAQLEPGGARTPASASSAGAGAACSGPPSTPRAPHRPLPGRLRERGRRAGPRWPASAPPCATPTAARWRGRAPTSIGSRCWSAGAWTSG